VPIVLATIPLTAGHPDGSLVFNVVFVTVLVSLIVQSGTVGMLVKRLGFAEDLSAAHAQAAMIDGLVADLVEVHLTARSPLVGTRLADHSLPNEAVVAFVVREARTFVPDDDLVLAAADVLLVVVAPGTQPATLTAWATHPS